MGWIHLWEHPQPQRAVWAACTHNCEGGTHMMCAPVAVEQCTGCMHIQSYRSTKGAHTHSHTGFDTGLLVECSQ